MAEFEKAIIQSKQRIHKLFSNVEDAMAQLTDEVDDFEDLQTDVISHLEELVDTLTGAPLEKATSDLEKWQNIDLDDLRVETPYNTDQEFGRVEELPIV